MEASRGTSTMWINPNDRCPSKDLAGALKEIGPHQFEW